ncbi:hypothetical protein PGT21_023787 [Puccinia graminis f. sp. tritici]|uniref:Uncharacterized protein n=1 Tax=Puccinia graminis f. sp. tritici TaxID=56615 RepID=A0A5B0PIR1_PUCGR|nr:hypothetical protein PGT21_023787 [Puccinia graminis f. sp. tritici]
MAWLSFLGKCKVLLDTWVKQFTELFCTSFDVFFLCFTALTFPVEQLTATNRSTRSPFAVIYRKFPMFIHHPSCFILQASQRIGCLLDTLSYCFWKRTKAFQTKRARLSEA